MPRRKQGPDITFTCEVCHKPVTVAHWRTTKGRVARFCSRRCTNLGTLSDRETQRLAALSGKPAHNNAQITITCQWCTKPVAISPSRQAITKYCSRACKQAASRKPLPPTRYRFITVNDQKVLEHRHIIEQHIGRALTPRETIHHINHDRHDNRLENLQILDRSIHGRVHTYERKNIKNHRDPTFSAVPTTSLDEPHHPDAAR